MLTAYYTEDYTDNENLKFRIEHYFDDVMSAPWEEFDGHGPVSDWTKRKKKPGELILNENDKGYKRFYDFQAAMKAARVGHWGRGEDVAHEVMTDCLYLRDWSRGVWHYMGIVAFPLSDDGDELRSKEQSLWGIESCCDRSYLQEITETLLRDVGADI